MPLPQTSLSNLGRLRGREQTITFVWGLVRVIALVVVLLVLACLVDRWIDTYRETPFGLRLAMTLLQPILAAAAVYCWILRPAFNRVSDDRLAKRVEEEMPEYGHRLVTAIQLNRESAKTLGMSPQLIKQLTNEAEDISGDNDLRSLADTSRLGWSLGVLAIPFVAVAAFLLILKFDFNLAGILVKRQLLFDDEIPHFIMLENDTPRLWPSGDVVTLRYKVYFKNYVEPTKVGSVRLVPTGLPAEEHPLKHFETIDDNHAIFVAEIPPMTLNFEHRAWLGDGRTRKSSEVVFEPRPVVTHVGAWVQLPDFVGKKPDGSAYETLMNQGEVVGLPGSPVRLLIRVQKAIKEANLILIRRGKTPGSEVESRPTPMTILREPTETDVVLHGAESSFVLDTDLLAYRIEVKDENGFANSSPPRRGIALAADDPPHVTLLPERFGGVGEASTEDSEVEGIPVPLGKNVRIAYTAQSQLGLSRARLVYRVNEGDWNYLPLRLVTPTEEMGLFDPRKGVFANTGGNDEVEFARMPSFDLSDKPSDLEGGGRFDFKTRALKKKLVDGKETELEVGDRVEFYVEVFDKKPAASRQPGRSDARIKGIVTDAQFVDWVVQTLQSEARLKQLEEKQRGVFRRPE